MTHYEFLSKILTCIEEIQSALNNLRTAIKEEIHSAGAEK